MPKNQVHVTFKNGYWNVLLNGTTQQSFKTKEDAVRSGTDLAKKTMAELTVHNMDGTIAYKNSYGNDPFPPRG